jgi:hypothetical protein
MEQELKQELEDLIKGMECPRDRDFACYKKHWELFHEPGVAKAGPLRLKCFQQDRFGCKFSFSFGYTHYCICPSAVYIANRLGR